MEPSPRENISSPPAKHHIEDSPLLPGADARISTLLAAPPLRFDSTLFTRLPLLTKPVVYSMWLLGEGGMDFSWSNQSSASVCHAGLT